MDEVLKVPCENLGHFGRKREILASLSVVTVTGDLGGFYCLTRPVSYNMFLSLFRPIINLITTLIDPFLGKWVENSCFIYNLLISVARTQLYLFIH